jgi:hypothetical protein
VVPPALNRAQHAELKAAVQAAPRAAGLELANWNWKVVRQFVRARFGQLLSSFRADVELRAKWVLRGEPALVATTSPKLGEKATYSSAVCLETGEVQTMTVLGHTNDVSSRTYCPAVMASAAGPVNFSMTWTSATSAAVTLRVAMSMTLPYRRG